MPDKKISQLNDAAPLTGSELIPLVQNNVTKKIQVNVLQGDLQSAYNNSSDGTVTTDATRGAVKIKGGTASNAENIQEFRNNAGELIGYMDGFGRITATDGLSSYILPTNIGSAHTNHWQKICVINVTPNQITKHIQLSFIQASFIDFIVKNISSTLHIAIGRETSGTGALVQCRIENHGNYKLALSDIEILYNSSTFEITIYKKVIWNWTGGSCSIINSRGGAGAVLKWSGAWVGTSLAGQVNNSWLEKTIAESTPGLPSNATETVAGIAEIATQAEVNAGTNDTTFVTPAKLAGYLAGQIGGGGVTNTTYANLVSMIGSSSLTPGTWYRLTDFQTIYDQPDFDSNGAPKTTVVTKTSAPEIIWVFAVANNAISCEALSETYPQDSIKYDHSFSQTEVMGAAAKGRISERIDENGNRADYDFRTVVFIRYESHVNSGVFNSVNDNGGVIQEFLSIPEFCRLCIVGDSPSFPFLLSNNVLCGRMNEADAYCTGITIGIYSRNNTIYGSGEFSNYIKIGNLCSYITIPETGYITIDDYCYNITIQAASGTNYRSNLKIGRNCENITMEYNGGHTFGDWCRSIIIKESCFDFTFGDFCHDINITGGTGANWNFFSNVCSGITIGRESSYNTFGSGSNSIVLGNACSNNNFGSQTGGITFGNNCNDNSIGNNSLNLTFGDNCKGNTIGSTCGFNYPVTPIAPIVFGNDCLNNKIGNSCYSITFGGQCSNNVIGNWCNEISFMNFFINRHILGDGCYNITLYTVETNLDDNVFGNLCHDISINDGSNSQNKFSEGCNSIIFSGSGNYDNSFGNNCQNISFAGNNQKNIIGYNCSGISFGDNNLANEIGTSGWNITFTNSNTSIKTGYNCSLSIGSSNLSLKIGDSVEGIIGNSNFALIIGNNCNALSIGNSNQNIIMQNSNSNLIFGDNCINNNFGIGISNLDFTTTPATHVRNNYDCEIKIVQGGAQRLFYYDSSFNLINDDPIN
jgi:hypothetical protein